MKETIYRWNRFGPIQLDRTEDQVAATGPSGRTLVVHGYAGSWAYRVIPALRGPGVEVTLDGERLARLVQAERGRRRVNRAVHVVTDRPDALRAGLFFRLRGYTKVSLETRERRLVTPPPFLPWPQWLRVAAEADETMVLLYAAATPAIWSVLQAAAVLTEPGASRSDEPRE